MSHMTGTQIAAGVAQTALQAQQVARLRDRRERKAAETRRIPEIIEAHLRALEEGDRSDSSTAPHIDQHLPEHQSPPQAELAPSSGSGHASADVAPAQPQFQSNLEAEGHHPLYKHLDVQA